VERKRASMLTSSFGAQMLVPRVTAHFLHSSFYAETWTAELYCSKSELVTQEVVSKGVLANFDKHAKINEQKSIDIVTQMQRVWLLLYKHPTLVE